jgi:hypothetical protein
LELQCKLLSSFKLAINEAINIALKPSYLPIQDFADKAFKPSSLLEHNIAAVVDGCRNL